ncbi:pyrokinin-1 receptor [Caerostris extrusa]|uniref:Pyrokinin-1 receptor n=1 Tax=Caerostris extrusa TaxID=172846 RepID=A0AAV4UEJ5_CAEEX|nr:pyrokinin-1 receptor [Caerostris extrusa]
MTDDITIVTEVPGHDHSHYNQNGSHPTGRRMTGLPTAKNVELLDGNFCNKTPKKKTSTTISNASLQMVEAFDDSSISDYIDQMKETQT